MEEIDIIKWWGAILGTIAFGWNVYNSLSNAPKFKVKIRPNTTYPDSRVISSEKIENGERKEIASYLHIEITNVGKQPATVTNISATHSGKTAFGGKLSSTSCRFISHNGQHVPLFIPPGQLWSCRFEMTDLYSLAEHGVPEIHIEVSYKNRPIVLRPKFTANKLSQQDAASGAAA